MSFSRHCPSEYLVGTIGSFLLMGPRPVANASIVLFDNVAGQHEVSDRRHR